MADVKYEYANLMYGPDAARRTWRWWATIGICPVLDSIDNQQGGVNMLTNRDWPPYKVGQAGWRIVNVMRDKDTTTYLLERSSVHHCEHCECARREIASLDKVVNG